MTEKEISQQSCFELSEKQASRETYQRKPYHKPMLQLVNTSTDRIAGGSTSNQLENSSGVIGNS